MRGAWSRKQKVRFFGMQPTVSWQGKPFDPTVKTLAKMFREILHLKPPRGRQGRLLRQDAGICVIITSHPDDDWVDIRQDEVTLEEELRFIEASRYPYTISNRLRNNEDDLKTLAQLHRRKSNKDRVAEKVNALDDLIQGLMGLHVINVQYTETPYGKFKATMLLDNFTIVVEEQ